MGRTRQRAFSLVELLVVMSLLTVIILGLMVVFNQTQRAFRTGMSQVDVLESGRATMDLMTREVEGMTAMTGFGSNVINCFIQIPSYQELEQELPGSTFQRVNVLQDFFFLSRVNQEWVGTGYTVLNGESGVGTLYRYTTNIHVQTLPQVIGGYAPIQGPFDLFNTALTPPLNFDRLTRVADGVIHFRVTAYGTNGVLLDPFYDAGVFTNITVETDSSPSSTYYAFRSNALPTAVEIELALVEPDVWKRVEALPTVAIRRDYLSTNVTGKVHVFQQRVPIRRVDTDAYKQ